MYTGKERVYIPYEDRDLRGNIVVFSTFPGKVNLLAHVCIYRIVQFLYKEMLYRRSITRLAHVIVCSFIVYIFCYHGNRLLHYMIVHACM